MKSKIDSKEILDDNKEIINITPEDIELDKIELSKESAPATD